MTAKSDYTIHEAHRLLKTKQISSVELTKIYLERTQRLEPRVHSLVTLTAENALQQAQKADQLIAAGQISALTGIPAIIKDNMCTLGVKTTCSSKMLANFVPPYSATVVEKLQQAEWSWWAKPTWMNSPWAPLLKTRPFSLPAIPGIPPVSPAAAAVVPPHP